MRSQRDLLIATRIADLIEVQRSMTAQKAAHMTAPLPLRHRFKKHLPQGPFHI